MAKQEKSVTFRILNETLGIGHPVVNMKIPTFYEEDVQDLAGRSFARLTPFSLRRSNEGESGLLNRFLHAKRGEFSQYSGRKGIQVILEIIEKTIVAADGTTRVFHHLDLFPTQLKVTHRMKVVPKGDMGDTLGDDNPSRTVIQIAQAKGNSLVLEELRSEQQVEVAEPTPPPAKKDTTLRMPKEMRQPTRDKREYKFVRGARVLV